MNRKRFEKLKVGDKVLVREPLYGYQIRKRNITCTKGLGPYPCLVTALGDGLVEVSHKHDHGYRLTVVPFTSLLVVK